MRPLSLTFTAFGSYPGTESIDFTELAGLGLYVVTGPTGSGKTTVFDAMTYALYGELPGDRRANDIRSHHAAPAALCTVTFRFEVEGIAYCVTRTPEQFRPSSRAADGFVKQTAKAELVRESDGVGLASGARPVLAACAELVGLDAEQFQRVVLLPQGKFQQFLLADTKERQPLLRQLFDSGRWLTVVERLRSRAAEANNDVESIEALLGNHRHGVISNLHAAAGHVGLDARLVADPELASAASLDELASLHAQLDHIAGTRREAAEAAAARAAVATEAETTARRVVDDWTNRRDLRDALALLDERAPSIDLLRARLLADATAQPVAAALRALDLADGAVATAETDLESALAAVTRAGAVAAVPLPDTPDLLVAAISAQRARIGSERAALDAVMAADAALQRITASITTASEERSRISDQLTQIGTDLSERRARVAELASEAALTAERQRQVEQATERLGRAARVAQLDGLIADAGSTLASLADTQRELLARFVAGAAPTLATTLVLGDPCPVCGSLEHPQPASSADDQLVDSAELERAAQRVAEATAAFEALTAERDRLRDELGEAADRPVPQLEAELLESKAALAASDDALAESRTLTDEIDTIDASRAVLAERATALDLDLVRLTTEQDGAETAVGDAAAALGELADRWRSEGAALVEVFDSGARSLDLLDTACSDWRDRLSALDITRGARSNAQSSFDAALAASGLPDRASVDAALLPAPERTALEATVTTFDADILGTRARLTELEARPLPIECPDITAIALDAAEKREAAQLAADDSSRLAERLTQAGIDLAEARRIELDAGTAFVRAEQLEALHRTCNGQGPRRIAIETWVLAKELDRVVLAASVHLERMTAGRYRLERTDAADHGNAQAGLDLRVLDAHTGVGRRPGSLSGGEQFQASLALALGLADVVSMGGSGSGKVFEALFVDEGFGSLDPESLAQAVDALHQIHAMGRTVGVITHVEGMKDDLTTGIRVERLGDGRGSTLTCYPEI